MTMIKSISFRNLLNLSQQQLVMVILLFILSSVLVWILSRGLFDLIRYFAFRFSHHDSFVPKSWLFITVLGLISVFLVSRAQVARAATIEIVADSDTQLESAPVSQRAQDLISTLSCALVVAGIIFEIGKRRGVQLRLLQINSRLTHPSATAVRTEVALRATLVSNSSDFPSIYLQANSVNPIFVPLGVSDSKIVLVDIGEQSVINICAGDASQSSAVLRALIAAALFTGGKQIKPILLRKLDVGNRVAGGIGTGIGIEPICHRGVQRQFQLKGHVASGQELSGVEERDVHFVKHREACTWGDGSHQWCDARIPGACKPRNASLTELLLLRELIPAILLMKPAILRDVVQLHTVRPQVHLRPGPPRTAPRHETAA